MKKATKRILSLMLAVVMIALFAACDSGYSSVDYDRDPPPTFERPTLPSFDPPGLNDDPVSGEDPVTPDVPVDTNTLTASDLSYVMIYNPKIYDENQRYDSSKLKTGDISSQIVIDSYRGDGLQEESEFISISQKDLLDAFPFDEIQIEDNKATFFPTTYYVGNVRSFYCHNMSNINNRSAMDLTCVYAGEHCYVWSSGMVPSNMAVEYGQEFDNRIFNFNTDTFGTARFTTNGGKVHLLFYPMEVNGLLGLSAFNDMYADGEVTANDISTYKLNTNHAIVHINARYAAVPQNKTAMFGTLSHEFQHTIFYGHAFNTPNFTISRSWITEAFSGYSEETLYPGTKEFIQHYDAFTYSDSIRNGQSLYNFDTSSDIGPYGSVYYFSEYLADIAGSDVFSNITEYWSNSYSYTLSEAEAIYNAMPSHVLNNIDSAIAYPSNINFNSNHEAWLSKLVLDFHLSTLSNKDNVKNFDHITPQALLYDALDDAEIEGGGRIIVTAKSNSFEIPSDADSGLVYVGLDKNFNVVTDFVCK